MNPFAFIAKQTRSKITLWSSDQYIANLNGTLVWKSELLFLCFKLIKIKKFFIIIERYITQLFFNLFGDL